MGIYMGPPKCLLMEFGSFFVFAFRREIPPRKATHRHTLLKLRLERTSNDFHDFVGSLSYYVRALSPRRSPDERITDISTCDGESRVSLLDVKVLLHLRVEPVVASQQPRPDSILLRICIVY